MKQSIGLVMLSASLGASGVQAQVPEAEWEQFKAEFSAMSQRVQALEIENKDLRAASKNTIKVEDLAATNAEVNTLKNQNAESSWTDRVAWKGNFRFRYEDIHQEGSDDRERYRVRARPSLAAKITDNIEVGFGMVTGSDDPISGNQTLGGGSNSKNINLDLAYASWTGLPGTEITIGKFYNPIYSPQKSQLLFDSDFRPEGVAINWANELFFAHTSFNFIESDSNQAEQDNYGVWVAQVGTTLTPFDGAKLTLAAAYLDIPTEGEKSIIEPDDPDADFYGNSSIIVDGQKVYEYDYKLVTGSVDFGIEVRDLPLNFYATYVENQDADEFDTGYLVGVKLGSAKKKGSWQVAYQYQVLDADATLAAVTNSNIAGGGTDGKGSLVTAKYAIDDRWYVASTYFFDNKTDIDLGDNLNYDRFQLDTGFKY